MSHIPNNSRFQQKQEKRRKSILLNVILGIVLLIAITVSYQLLTSSSKQEAATEVKKTKSVKQKETANNGKLVVKEDETKTSEEEQASTQPADDTKTEDTKVSVPNQSGSGVQEAYTNPSWKPIGTSQSGEHTTQFDDTTQDWKEMISAISYAIQVPSDTLTILFIGNNGPNKAIGTVQAKDTKQKYKVYIEWVDNQGWQPTLVQVMK